MSQYTDIAKRCLQDEAQAVLMQVDHLDESFDKVVNLILNCHGKVIITGVGKSGHIGAKIAATTHYAELKAYALETPRVENGSCEFDIVTLKPTYRLLIGMPGKSNALAISERLGLDKNVIKRAEQLVSLDNKEFENVVDKLEATRKKMEEEYESAKALSDNIQKEKEELEKQRKDFITLREKEMERAKGAALKVVEQAKREAHALLHELEKLKKEQATTQDAAELAKRAKSVVKRGMSAIDSATDTSIETEDDEDYVLPRDVKAGDTVIIRNLGKSAKVISNPDKSGNVQVLAGAIKTRVSQSNLRLVENAPKEEKSKSTGKLQGESRLNITPDTRIDLRGHTVDDCLIELDRFIDHALRTGLNEFTIIHGKGTGALKKAVTDYLKKCPYVKSSRLGVYGEGEDGVTIVVLK